MQLLTGAHVQALSELYTRLNQDMRMFCVLSKVDLVDYSIKCDAANVVYSEKVHLLRQCVKVGSGMPLNQVCCNEFMCIYLQ